MNQKKIVKAMKALSNKNRFEIFMVIFNNQKNSSFEEEECFVYDWLEKLNIGTPTISHHLKELENAELIVLERRGKNIVARLNEKTVKELGNVLTIE